MRIELSPTTMIGNFVIQAEDILEDAGFTERKSGHNAKTYIKIVDDNYVKFKISIEERNKEDRISDIVIFLLKVPNGRKGFEDGLFKIRVGGTKPARFIGENLNEFAEDLRTALDYFTPSNNSSASIVESKSSEKLVQSFIKDYL